MKRIFIILFALLAVVIVLPAQSTKAQACSVNTGWQIYTVAGGDTVAKIARRYNSTVSAIVAANCLANPNQISVGQQLRVPPSNGQSGTQYAFTATHQVFERGFMIWRADTGLISVFFGSGSTGNYEQFPVFTYGFLPENPVAGNAPSRLVKPIFGFGKVWGNYPHIRNALGWATNGEQAYQALYFYTPPQTTITVPGGQRISMLNGAWAFIDSTIPTVTPGPVVANIPVTYQPFERGFMVWFADNGQLIAFFGNSPSDGPFGGVGSYSIFPSQSYGNLPSNPYTEPAPPARFHPIMGFGKVWYNFPTTRSRLGWALQSEMSYTSTIVSTNTGLLSLTLPDKRLVNLSSGAWNAPRIAGAVDAVLITPPATPQLTATPFNPANITPTATPAIEVTPTAIDPSAQIITLKVDPTEIVSSGTTINIQWETQGTALVDLAIKRDNDEAAIELYKGLPPVGTQTFAVPSYITSGSLNVVLMALSGDGATVTEQAGVVIPINYSETTVTTSGAYQSFENGFMLWRGDTGEVMLLHTPSMNTGFYPQSYYSLFPSNPVTDAVPQGYVMPINAFGRLWGNEPGMRQMMGWATAAEQGYTLDITSLPDGSSRYTLPDGRSITVNQGLWSYIQ